MEQLEQLIGFSQIYCLEAVIVGWA